jgi:hypothetical protein
MAENHNGTASTNDARTDDRNGFSYPDASRRVSHGEEGYQNEHSFNIEENVTCGSTEDFSLGSHGHEHRVSSSRRVPKSWHRMMDVRDRRRLLDLKRERLTLRQAGSQFPHLYTGLLREAWRELKLSERCTRSKAIRA